MSSSLWSLPQNKFMFMQQSLVHSSLSSSQLNLKLTIPSKNQNQKWTTSNTSQPSVFCCSNQTASTTSTTTNSTTAVISTTISSAPPVVKKRKRYRKLYPGETEGITEEMRFVAMKLRNLNGKKYTSSSDNDNSSDSEEDSSNDGVEPEEEKEETKEDGGLSVDSDGGETWEPSMEGFLKFLVDNQLVFNTVERIVDESNDVAYAYFRKTGLERSEGLSKDLEWFSEQGFTIPEASTSGVSYAKYLEELAERSAPLFLAHFYNVYFSHIAGGQVITRQVSEKILEGRELEFYRWDGDAQELLKGVREKLNLLGEYWTRDEKTKCLKEAAKSFKFLGQIVRLIIL